MELRTDRRPVAVTSIGVFLLVLTGCTVGPNYHRPETPIPAAWAEALLATTQSRIPALHTAVKQSIHRLGVLLGSAPETLLQELSQPGPFPLHHPTCRSACPPICCAGVPASGARSAGSPVRRPGSVSP